MPTRLTAPALALLLLAGCASTPPAPTMDEFRALTAKTESLEKERAALEVRVGVLEKQLESLHREAEYERARLETEIKRLELETANLQGMLDSVQESNSSSKGSDSSPPGSTATAAKGTVLAADASMNVYLISIGTKDGVKIADELTVYRGDTFVAQVVVDRVFEDKASVVVKKLAGKLLKKSEIKTGDTVGDCCR